MEKEKRRLEKELMRNELCVVLHQTILKFKSQFTDCKLKDKDVIHVLSSIISNKTD